MWTSLIICCITIALMIASILFFPKLRLGKVKLDVYWLITVLGAVCVLIFDREHIDKIGGALIADTAVNPLKILALFLSMTLLSVYLDELGFFRLLASIALKHAKSCKRLFFYLYITVSVLTVFTSNDIIILSFTPFICYFAKNAKINPLPYLAAEFVAANTWSMALIIGNPTNIYLASAYGLDFLKYICYAVFPTLFGGIVALLALYLMFRKKLNIPICAQAEEVVIEDKLSLIVGIVHLAVCTVLLAISSYVGIEMWIVSVSAVGSLVVFSAVISIVRRKKPGALFGCLRRAPYQLVPFVLSMFIMIVSLSEAGVTKLIGDAFGSDFQILKYGVSSFAAANLINNIPMSVLFSSVMQSTGGAVGIAAVMATVIGSNVGAFFTPIGALAGIMWQSIIGEHDVKFSYLDFLKIGLFIAIPTLFASLGGLYLSVTIFGA